MKIFQLILVGIVLACMALLAETWIAMICIGAAHSADARIPAFNYESMFFLSLTIGTLIGTSVWSTKTQTS